MEEEETCFGGELMTFVMMDVMLMRLKALLGELDLSIKLYCDIKGHQYYHFWFGLHTKGLDTLNWTASSSRRWGSR